jgi:hypothetical protein
VFEFLSDIGSALPGIGPFIKSSDEQNMEDQYGKNQALWKQMLDNYQGPESDPNYNTELEQLRQQGHTGLTPTDRAAMLDAYSSASDMARGREGAISQNQILRGGGVARSGQSAALQQQAAQQAAQRYQSGGMQQAGIASQRALQARQGYLNTLERNKQSLNNYKLYAAGGATGANTQMGNMYGARDASRKARVQHDVDSAASIAMGMPPQGGGGGGSYQPSGDDDYSFLNNRSPYGGGGV